LKSSTSLINVQSIQSYLLTANANVTHRTAELEFALSYKLSGISAIFWGFNYATNKMFTETSSDQSYFIQPILSRQNNKNTAHLYTSHKTQARPKSNQTEKAISKFTISLPDSIRSKTIQSLVHPSTLLHTSTISRSKTLSRPVLEEDEDIEYENVEYLKDEDVEYENVEYLKDEDIEYENVEYLNHA